MCIYIIPFSGEELDIFRGSSFYIDYIYKCLPTLSGLRTSSMAMVVVLRTLDTT